MAVDGGCERDVVHRMNKEYRAWGVLKSVLSNRGLGIKAKKYLYEKVIVLMALYQAEAWGMRSAERRKVNVIEIKCLRSLVGVPQMDRVMNEEVTMRKRLERVESPGAYVTEEFHVAISGWPCVLLDCPPMLWWLSPEEGWDAITRCGWDKL